VSILVFTSTADYITTAKILKIVSERGQGGHDIVNVRDISFPLRLLALAPGELL
jgi:hypothetical protein